MLVCGSMQVPQHRYWPLGQGASWQVPLTQLFPEVHVVPHAPQLVALLFRSTQAPLQIAGVVPAHWHTPATHACPAETLHPSPQVAP